MTKLATDKLISFKKSLANLVRAENPRGGGGVLDQYLGIGVPLRV